MASTTQTRPAGDRRTQSPGNNPKRAIMSALMAAAVTFGFAGTMAKACGAPAQPKAAANQALDLVNALADKLVLGLESDATMQYAKADGTVVTVVQSDPRRAYHSGTTTYILTPDNTWLCTPLNKTVHCETGPGSDSMSPALAKSISEAFGGDFVAPEAALGRLATVAHADAALAVTSKRGEADCVSVTAGSIRTETACVNPAGLLAFFDGTSDAGKPARVELQQSSPTAPDDAFTPPQAVSPGPSPAKTPAKPPGKAPGKASTKTPPKTPAGN